MFLLLLLAACGRPEPADVVLHSGTIHHGVRDAAGSPLDATDTMAIRGGVIVATGEQVRRYMGSETREIDLNGAHVLPGFHDGHTHLLAGSFARDRLLLLGTPTMESMATRVANYAATAPDEPWIVGYGWLAEQISDPHKDPIDAVVPDRPVLLVSNSGHEAIINSVALEQAGIDADTPDPPGGHLGRDPETGEPTGYLSEAAVSLVADLVLAEYDDDLLTSGLDRWLEEFSASGITHIHEILAVPGFDIGRPWVFSDRELAGTLPLRVTWYVPLFHPDDLPLVADFRDEVEGELVRFGGAKLWVDGSMGNAEAWVSEPYLSHPEHHGTIGFDAEAMVQVVAEAEALGVPLKLHVNGDAAIDAALSAFEALPHGPTLPHVLDHVVLLGPDHEARIQALGLPASVQPTHYLPATYSNTRSELGEDRWSRAYALRDLADAGVELALGTDWPVWPSQQPLLVAWGSATHHQGETGLTIAEALRAYTEGGARALGREHELGRLEEGMLADFVVLAHDPLDVPLADVPGVDILQVWVAGRRVR